MNKRQLKAERKVKAESEQTKRDAIAKAIRRHNGTPHAFVLWGKHMSILRAIHKEIAPKLELIRAAEDFLFYDTGRHNIGK